MGTASRGGARRGRGGRAAPRQPGRSDQPGPGRGRAARGPGRPEGDGKGSRGAGGSGRGGAARGGRGGMGAREPGRPQPPEPGQPRGPRAGAAMCARLGAPRVTDFRRVLMKTGLVLVVLGHLSFIAAALLHGTVLRYVAAPRDPAALQYCVVNILSVTSAIVVIISGIAAIILSCYLPSIPLRWTVFSSSVACTLLSLICALGLLASITVTFATQGRALLAACTFENPELLSLAPDCPFDPTRIYSSSLCLWAISLVFCLAESVSAVRCAQFTHQLLELRPWWGKSRRHSESPEPVEDHDLLSCTSAEPLTL